VQTEVVIPLPNRTKEEAIRAAAATASAILAAHRGRQRGPLADRSELVDRGRPVAEEARYRPQPVGPRAPADGPFERTDEELRSCSSEGGVYTPDTNEVGTHPIGLRSEVVPNQRRESQVQRTYWIDRDQLEAAEQAAHDLGTTLSQTIRDAFAELVERARTTRDPT